MSWTDERVEMLRKLWLEGRSASQIASELANGITRNAVIGKVHRLGLSSRAKAPSASPPRPRARTAAPRAPIMRPLAPVVRGANALALNVQPTMAPSIEAFEDVVFPIAEYVTIMELRESMCRWPIGDPASSDFRFCGSRSTTGASYCDHHAQLAYQPPQDRRREREREKRLQRIV